MIDIVIAVHGRGMARPCDGVIAALPVIGRGRDAGSAGGADKLTRRGTRRRLIHRNFIGGDNFVVPFRPVDNKTCPVGRFAGEAVSSAGIFSPGQIARQPDHGAGFDPIGCELDLCHAGIPETGCRVPAAMITTSSPRARIAAARRGADAAGTAISSTSRRAR